METTMIVVGSTTSPEFVQVDVRNRDTSDEAMNASCAAVAAKYGRI